MFNLYKMCYLILKVSQCQEEHGVYKERTRVQVFKNIVLTEIKKTIDDKEDANTFLCNLYKISPIAFEGVILRILAIELDKKYEDHISTSKYMYIINSYDNSVAMLCNPPKIHKKLPIFRSKRDAEFAKFMYKSLVKEFS